MTTIAARARTRDRTTWKRPTARQLAGGAGRLARALALLGVLGCAQQTPFACARAGSRRDPLAPASVPAGDARQRPGRAAAPVRTDYRDAAGAAPVRTDYRDAAGAAPAGTDYRDAAGAAPAGTDYLDAAGAAPAGTYYLDAAGAPATLQIDCASGSCGGTLYDPALGVDLPVEAVRFREAEGTLDFRVSPRVRWRWFRTRIVEGILTGRFALGEPGADEPTDSMAFSRHVTGWKLEHFNHALTPRVWNLVIDHHRYATLRLDRDSDSRAGSAARFKVHATRDLGADAEGDEHDAIVERWDGRQLALWFLDRGQRIDLEGVVSGNRLGGLLTDGRSSFDVSGSQQEVLGHGFASLSGGARLEWQRRARQQLLLLLMDGGAPPLSVRTARPTAGLPPRPMRATLEDRDDALYEHPARYRLDELRLSAALADRHGGAPLVRAIHGWLATPTTRAPRGGFPAVIALNGHTGSASKVMTPDNDYFWYGDAFARRDYVVLAIDVGHRPPRERGGLYRGADEGDDPENGNGPHPAIRSRGMDADFEEVGERAWDVMRAVDWLSAQRNVDPRRILVTGLSLGAEVATYAAALDTRIAAVVAAGFSPDLAVLHWRGSHGCWQWARADVREYIGPSDLHALIAPRPLIVETGRHDPIYSRHEPTFAADKQVMRRTRAAYGDQPANVVHYLHYDVHRFHAGGANAVRPTEPGVRVPATVAPPTVHETAWQNDGDTVMLAGDLFQLLERLLPR